MRVAQTLEELISTSDRNEEEEFEAYASSTDSSMRVYYPRPCGEGQVRWLQRCSLLMQLSNLILTKGFCKDVGRLILGRNKFNFDGVVFNLLSSEMIVNLKMF